MAGKRVGELNSWWAFMLKVLLVMFPVLATSQIAFSAWLVSRVINFESRISVIETKIASTDEHGSEQL